MSLAEIHKLLPVFRAWRLADASSSFDVVELDKPRVLGGLFEVEVSRLKNVAAEFLPRVALRKDRVAKRARVKSTLFGIANFED
jgi:hypothetical protein